MDTKKVRAAVARVPIDDLIDWATRQIADSPEIPTDLPRGVQPQDLRPDKVGVSKRQFDRIQNLIRTETGFRFFRDEWDYEDHPYGEEPDYTEIENEFRLLAELGYVTELLNLGGELMELGTEQFQETDPSEETFDQFRSCMTIVVDAMRTSELPPVDRMIAYWGLMLNDQYDILAEAEAPINGTKLSQQDWLSVAEEFTNRLKSMPVKSEENSLSSDYDRHRVMQRAIDALKAGDAFDEAIELMESELPHCHNYVELVDLLIETRDIEKAKRWVIDGRLATKNTFRGIAHQLAEKMREIAILEENLPQASAITASFFFRQPSVSSFLAVKDSCQTSGEWKKVRDVLLVFLETGFFSPTASDWPLPKTGLGRDEPIQRKYHPDYRLLIDIALEEKRLNDALKWYQQAPRDLVDELKIASALKDFQPDIALDIWRTKIDDLIATVNVKAYLRAMPLLGEMKELMRKEGRSTEFQQYVNRLRVQHKNKPRLMREIDLVESGH